jgi:hypothetical protein
MEVNAELESIGLRTGIGPEDYIDDAHLPCINLLLEENTCWAAEKAEEWHREVELQEKIYADLDSNRDK